MGISCFQLNIFALTSQKSKLNKQLATIENKKSEITYQLQNAITSAALNHEKDNTGIWLISDPQVQLLQMQQNSFDMQQKDIETSLKAIEKNLEAIEKQQEKNAKDGIAKLAS